MSLSFQEGLNFRIFNGIKINLSSFTRKRLVSIDLDGIAVIMTVVVVTIIVVIVIRLVFIVVVVTTLKGSTLI